MSAALEVRNVTAGYGQVTVLRDVTLRVDPGEVVAVVGANGAGKSTLLGVISGLIAPVEGQVHFDGQDATRLSAHERPGRGLVLVPEGGRLFPFMTVEENLRLGGFSKKEVSAERLAEMFELFPILAERRNQLAGKLSGGERQMCAVARAIMSRPKLLMLDEPSVGLSPLMVSNVFELVKGLAERVGLSIILVEQNVGEALEISDRAYVIEQGRITRDGRSDDLRSDSRIRAAYMGM